MNDKKNKQRTGVFALGYVDNNTYIDNLNKLLIETEKTASAEIVNQYANNKDNIEYLNFAGYPQFADGEMVTKSNKAKYIKLATPYTTKNGDKIYGWYQKERTRFEGITWGTDADFKRTIRLNNLFTIGRMYFDNKEDGKNFLNDIADNTIPESWKYKNKSSQVNHPILKSYLENVLERLIKESKENNNKIIYSTDRKYIIFNTNLLDKYFHEVIIVGKVEDNNGDILIHNPHRDKSTSELRTLKFGKERPVQPQFFDNVNDVIFQTDWEIDKNFDTFNHIIEDRRDRFPDEYKSQKTDILSRKLDDAIKFAVALAQRNYKFIVPMYYPQTNSIQLLMPIYLNGAYSKHPDFALILTPDSDHELYIPKTILPLDSAYQNARLIAKPDESWLNPDTIK